MSDINIEPDDLVEKILEAAPSFEADGKRYYIVERDTVLEESELLAYANSVLAPPPDPKTAAPSELVGATIGGKLMRWKPDTVLSWKLERSTFPDEATADKAHGICTGAGGAWNDAASEKGLKIRFAEADANTAPIFTFAYHAFSEPGLFAVAFFPNDPAFKRVVRIGAPTFEEVPCFDPTGVLRHELGHVLGFRHEHIRPEAPEHIESWVVGEIGAEVLSKYDSRSVMHYPMAGAGTRDFQLTEFDKAGFADLYTLPADQVREFAP